MTETTITILRYYLDGGVPRTEAVRWLWVPPPSAEGGDVDPGIAARARALPADLDPGLTPNLWVWTGANDPAASLPRPGSVVRGTRQLPEGDVIDTVDHTHADRSPHWNYYRLPLRPGVEIVTEDVWAAAVAAAQAVEAEAKAAREKLAEDARAAREVHRESARAKLAKLGLTADEVTAIIGG